MAQKTIQKSISIYEKILKNAWQTTWRHKELWFLGLLAGLAYSGTILQNVVGSVLRIRPANTVTVETLEQSSPSVPYIISYGSSLMDFPPGRLIATIIAALFVIAVVIFFLVMSQHMLLESIHRSANRKKHMRIGQIWATKKGVHFWRLFAIDALIVIATAIVTVGSSIPLALMLSDRIGLNFLAYLGFYLVVLPLLFSINIVGMFAIVHVVRRKDGIDRAISRAINALHKHWLSAAELALVLFLVNVVAYAFFAIMLFILTIVVAPFFLGAVGLGSLILMSLVGLMAALTGIVLYLAYFGGLTVFNYAVWTEYIERVERYGIMPALEGVVRKFFK